MSPSGSRKAGGRISGNGFGDGTSGSENRTKEAEAEGRKNSIIEEKQREAKEIFDRHDTLVSKIRILPPDPDIEMPNF